MWLDGVHGRIFGVLTEPANQSRQDIAMVLVGAGGLPHTGPNRCWVDLARRAAARGLSCFRVDLAGIDESNGDDRALRTSVSLHEPWRAQEITLVLNQLQARGIARRFVLGGACSGADLALRTALVDERTAV